MEIQRKSAQFQGVHNPSCSNALLAVEMFMLSKYLWAKHPCRPNVKTLWGCLGRGNLNQGGLIWGGVIGGNPIIGFQWRLDYGKISITVLFQ